MVVTGKQLSNVGRSATQLLDQVGEQVGMLLVRPQRIESERAREQPARRRGPVDAHAAMRALLEPSIGDGDALGYHDADDEHDDVDFRDENELKRFIRPGKWLALNAGSVRLLRVNVRRYPRIRSRWSPPLSYEL